MTTATGSCQCGGVSFTLHGASSTTACHCGLCRGTTGGVFILAAAVPADSAEITLAEGVTLQERATSHYLTRNRCSRCGAAIFNAIRSKRMAVDNYMAALLDDPSLLPLTHHIYYADRVVDVDDDLPKFDGFGVPG